MLSGRLALIEDFVRVHGLDYDASSFALQCFDSSFHFVNTESPPLHRTPPQNSESSYYNGQHQQQQISHETPKSLKGFSRASRVRDTGL